MPEHFRHEISKLKKEDKERLGVQKVGFKRADGDYLEVDEREDKHIFKDEASKLFIESVNMEMYIYQQELDLIEMYKDLIKEEVKTVGHINEEAYL